jgi:hypothetical protein
MIGAQDCDPWKDWENRPATSSAPPPSPLNYCQSDPPYMCVAICNPPMGFGPQGQWIFMNPCLDPWAGDLTKVFMDDVMTLGECVAPDPNDPKPSDFQVVQPNDFRMIPVLVESPTDGCTPPPLPPWVVF